MTKETSSEPEVITQDNPQNLNAEATQVFEIQNQYLYLVEPHPRGQSESLNCSEFPCVGLPSGRIRYETVSDSKQITQWRTVHATLGPKCKISLGNGSFSSLPMVLEITMPPTIRLGIIVTSYFLNNTVNPIVRIIAEIAYHFYK